MNHAPLPHVLLVTDGVTKQAAALRIDPERIERVGQALELFLREPEELVETGQLPPGAEPWFLELGECLYTVVDDGRLGPLHQGIQLFQAHEPLALEAPLLFERRPLPHEGSTVEEVMLAHLSLDRRGCRYDRDWELFHLRKRLQGREEIRNFLHWAASASVGPERAERALARRIVEDKELLLRAAAQRIFEAPFELYSRFVGRRRLIKDGLTTLRNIEAGDGGACSEKAQAMRLIADELEIPATYSFAGPDAKGEVPTDALLEILDTFDVEYSHAVQIYWNHVALLVELGGREVLIDASNGNIPFLWAEGEELTAMLDRRGSARLGLPHRYVVGSDDLYYHRVDQVLAERLLFALEIGWADPHVDLVHALDDELGLLTMPDLWLGLLPYQDEEDRQILHDWYRQKWIEPGLVRGVLFTDDPFGAQGPLAHELRERYPRAASAASACKGYIEGRLEEANPGGGYQVEFVVAGRLEETRQRRDDAVT
jgi:hypothetical protein